LAYLAGYAMKHDPKFTASTQPAGGWGSVQSLGRSLTQEQVPFSGPRILLHQNKPNGFACVSCAWAKPAKPHPFEFCEEGTKATTWEITNRRCPPKFFAEHTVGSLSAWSDHDLEEQGRLTHPMRWDAATDKIRGCRLGRSIRRHRPTFRDKKDGCIKVVLKPGLKVPTDKAKKEPAHA
jgi:hypothetical protein